MNIVVDFVVGFFSALFKPRNLNYFDIMGVAIWYGGLSRYLFDEGTPDLYFFLVTFAIFASFSLISHGGTKLFAE